MESLFPHAVGLLATAILLTTLTAQTVKQWREHSTTGIARWFFLGQVSASVCFVIYSLLIGSTLFAIANGLILLSAFAGYVVLRVNRQRALLRTNRDAAGLREATRPTAPDSRDAHQRVVVLG